MSARIAPGSARRAAGQHSTTLTARPPIAAGLRRGPPCAPRSTSERARTSRPVARRGQAHGGGRRVVRARRSQRAPLDARCLDAPAGGIAGQAQVRLQRALGRIEDLRVAAVVHAGIARRRHRGRDADLALAAHLRARRHWRSRPPTAAAASRKSVARSPAGCGALSRHSCSSAATGPAAPLDGAATTRPPAGVLLAHGGRVHCAHLARAAFCGAAASAARPDAVRVAPLWQLASLSSPSPRPGAWPAPTSKQPGAHLARAEQRAFVDADEVGDPLAVRRQAASSDSAE